MAASNKLGDMPVEIGNAAVSDAFIASRLNGQARTYGTLPRGLEVTAILERSLPA